MKWAVSILPLLIFVSCSKQNKVSSNKLKQFYISSETTPCFGACPIYSLKINGKSEAVLAAGRFTEQAGNFSAELSTEVMQSLSKQAYSADWKNYKDRYMTGYSDLPSTILRFSSEAGDTTTVVFEFGAAPSILDSIAQTIDRIRTQTVWTPIDES